MEAEGKKDLRSEEKRGTCVYRYRVKVRVNRDNAILCRTKRRPKHLHTHIYVYIHTHIYTHIHTHTHMHTPTHTLIYKAFII